MQRTVLKPSVQSSILAAGQRYVITEPTVIGRVHAGCPLEDCKRKRFWYPPDIAILDREGYISKHHAKVQLDAKGVCWIEDLTSLNGTAILRASKKQTGLDPSFYFETLAPGRGYMLVNGDIIALAYNLSRGPYLAISYHRS